MKKMMFNDRYGLTEAVIEKRKTVTRRIINPTPESQKPINTRLDDKGKCLEKRHYPDKFGGGEYEVVVASINTGKCPYKVGEIVAVAQSYYSIMESGSKMLFKCNVGIIEHKGWGNKMFVKADLMPHQIRILDVRAERLQDITDEDCLREGIIEERPEFYDLPVGSEKIYFHYHNFSPNARNYSTFDSAREAFADLIDKISGKGTWERNPYIWRIEFELIN